MPPNKAGYSVLNLNSDNGDFVLADDQIQSPLIGSPHAGTENDPLLVGEYGEVAEKIHVDDPDTSEKSSLLGACANLLKAVIGLGLLNIPYAFKLSGWGFLGLVVVVAIITSYSANTIYKGLYQRPLHLRRDNSYSAPVTYADLGDQAFGRAGRTLVNCVVIPELFAILCIFLILMGTSLKQLVPSLDMTVAMTISCGLVLPTVMIKSYSKLSFLSCGGIVTILCLFVALFVTLGEEWDNIDPPDKVLDLESLPQSFGISLFSFGGHVIFPDLYASLKDTRDAPKMVNICWAIVFVVCTSFGALGYYIFGEDAEDDITLNLPPGVIEKVVTGAVFANVLLTFALIFNPLAQEVESRVLVPNRCNVPPSLLSFGVRVFLVFAALGIACSLPYFGFIMSVVGAVLEGSTSIIFPALFYLKLFWRELSIFAKTVNIMIIFLGIAGAVLGVYYSTYALVHKLDQ